MSIGRFYAGIVALVRHPVDGTYLVLRRSAEKDVGAGDWECVTGRVDQGEGFTEAVHREVREELGVAVRIEAIVGTTHFYRGDERPENELVGVVYRCTIDDPEAIAVSWEHSEQGWVTAAEAEALLTERHWLSRLIRRAEALDALTPEALLAYYREHGFDT
jgi:8-oxo-dGTP pyrophosphatase MutT (NUDIX family)